MTQEEIELQNKVVSAAARAYDYFSEDELEASLNNEPKFNYLGINKQTPEQIARWNNYMPRRHD